MDFKFTGSWVHPGEYASSGEFVFIVPLDIACIYLFDFYPSNNNDLKYSFLSYK